MNKEIRVSNQTTIGSLFWFAGWLFAMGYFCTVDPAIGELPFWAILFFMVALIPCWPLALGMAVGMI